MYGVRIDVGRGSVMVDAYSKGPPDSSALGIDAAVQDLDNAIFAPAERLDMLGDTAFDGLTSDKRAAAHVAGAAMVFDEEGRLRSKLSSLVITGAVLGHARPLRMVIDRDLPDRLMHDLSGAVAGAFS